MKVVILAGGMGTRISEESHLRPKPMVEIGGRPILWHIMKIYSAYGFHDFIICLGFRGYVIKEYFSNYFLHMADVTFDMARNHMEVHRETAEPWRVTLVDTGATTNTGGRLKRVQEYVKDEPYFAMTYGDGVSDIDIAALAAFHTSHGKLATITAVRPPSRFGVLDIDGENQVRSFREKPANEIGWVNGGFFLLSPQVINLIDGDTSVWEHEPLEALAEQRQLNAFHHEGFWQPMDTLRDKNFLEDRWASGKAEWKVWP
ncbi:MULTISPECIES: glucose-1-phosphate cytidylyltransferase [Nitrospirillum]|uniref:Glucose-1-phosphate cytidylyltransferase n=1 Tax=Nitrospirillum amazonense TaxID=28077 RepID=A0A560FXH5_9PROT|nr:glucose-1-phosphate cytidylyltransferase [Nitrospirillum amazonense]MEC4590376.1 glucose-1-phosphate cytidylyltransferase [Nitrospirillum amazonense]TWB26335.1 glucose-1-phosphate cytidylyltransferase [Nitrospirillum amazonense]